MKTEELQGEIIDLGVATAETKGVDASGDLDIDHVTHRMPGGSGIADD